MGWNVMIDSWALLLIGQADVWAGTWYFFSSSDTSSIFIYINGLYQLLAVTSGSLAAEQPVVCIGFF